MPRVNSSRDAAAAQALTANLMFSTEVWIFGAYLFFRDNILNLTQ